MLPDVTRDSITDACCRLGLQDVHQFFLRAAARINPHDPHGFAQAAFFVWARNGYEGLDEKIKQFALECCDGQHKH